MKEQDNNVDPDRTRPEIEWSVSMDKHAISTDRFVIYGLSPPELNAFLKVHRVEGQAHVARLTETYGAPSQVAVGRDGQRAKLYWFPASREPYFVGSDFRNGTPLPPKVYSEVLPQGLRNCLAQVEPALRGHLEWLLDRPEFALNRLFHGVVFRRDPEAMYSGMHIGLKPDWLGLIGGHRNLLCEGMLEDLVSRLGFQQHWPTVQKVALAEPMAWTCYVSLQVRPSGTLGLNIYTRATPVVPIEGGVGLVEPGDGGTFPRPLVVTCRHRHLDGTVLRFRFHGPSRCYIALNGWYVDYGPISGSHRTLSEQELWVVDDVARSSCSAAGPGEPVAFIERLASLPGVYDVAVGPNLRKES